MPDGLSWLASLGSSAAALAVVMLFLRHLAAERVEFTQRDDKMSEVIAHNSQVIERNTTALGATAEVLRRNTDT